MSDGSVRSRRAAAVLQKGCNRQAAAMLSLNFVELSAPIYNALRHNSSSFYHVPNGVFHQKLLTVLLTVDILVPSRCDSIVGRRSARQSSQSSWPDCSTVDPPPDSGSFAPRISRIGGFLMAINR